jgi:putative chitinase
MSQNDLITPGILREIMPSVGARADVHAGPLSAAMVAYGVTNPLSQAAFIAQVLHETGGLRAFVESLNYTPEALLVTFNTSKATRFTIEQARQYGRTATHAANQEMIGNLAYANRMGNGDAASGDGFRFRGRGAFHVTGRTNYTAAARALGLDLITHPGQLELPGPAAMSAGWYWLANGLNALAQSDNIVEVSKRVNGGVNGLAERVELYRRAKKALA